MMVLFAVIFEAFFEAFQTFLALESYLKSTPIIIAEECVAFVRGEKTTRIVWRTKGDNPLNPASNRIRPYIKRCALFRMTF